MPVAIVKYMYMYSMFISTGLIQDAMVVDQKRTDALSSKILNSDSKIST